MQAPCSAHVACCTHLLRSGASADLPAGRRRSGAGGARPSALDMVEGVGALVNLVQQARWASANKQAGAAAHLHTSARRSGGRVLAGVRAPVYRLCAVADLDDRLLSCIAL